MMLAIFLLTLWPAPAPPIPISFPDEHAPIVVEQDARDLERAVNADRERQNLPPLRPDERLRAMALDWALHMANEHFFGHVDPEGRGLLDRVHEAKYKYHFVAENIALERDAEAADIGLMNSPEHAANILSKDARKVGVAAVSIAPRETLFVEDFSD
ncbi:MAG TPA: CAP domain-containing protein [Candidatus Acidoferrales bacterium]|nr:CAP domain-containing protein [Candidatus Acidoferrales bacterium]